MKRHFIQVALLPEVISQRSSQLADSTDSKYIFKLFISERSLPYTLAVLVSLGSVVKNYILFGFR